METLNADTAESVVIREISVEPLNADTFRNGNMVHIRVQGAGVPLWDEISVLNWGSTFRGSTVVKLFLHLYTGLRKHPRVGDVGRSPSYQDSLTADRRREGEATGGWEGGGTPVRGVATSGRRGEGGGTHVGGVATDGSRGERENIRRSLVTSGGRRKGEGANRARGFAAKRSKNSSTGEKERASPEDCDSDGGVYSPPSPYSLPATPSPPASPSLMPGSASLLNRRSHDSTGHAPLSSSGRKRKRRRSFSPETSSTSRLSVTPRSRRRLLDVAHLEPELDTPNARCDDDLLSKADCALERLRDNCYHSLDNFYSPNDPDQLNSNGTSNPPPGNSDLLADIQDYPNSDQLNSDLLDSDILSAHSSRPSVARSNVPGKLVSHIHVLSRTPAGPHVTVTSSEGNTVYLRLREGSAGKKPRESLHRRRGLLTVPFAELKASVEEEVSQYLIEPSLNAKTIQPRAYGSMLVLPR